LKKWEYLATYYNKLEGHKALQASIPNDDQHRQRLRQTLKDNRRQLPAQPPLLPVRPVVYRADGITPFGAPGILNPSIVMGAITGFNPAGMAMLNGRMVAPYQVKRPTLSLPPPPPKRTPVFRSRMFCITCGWRRNKHTVHEGVATTCKRNYCGRCHLLKIHHPPGKFGKDCTGPVQVERCSYNVTNWFSVSYCYCC
jgi:hypothetical protein